VAKDTVLNGTGQSVEISGGGAVRLLAISTNVVFEARGLTLADGRAVGTNGVDGGSAESAKGEAGRGGGILNQGGVVILNHCTLTNCSAQGGNSAVSSQGDWTGGAGWGGAICNLGGQLHLTNCVLSGNACSGGLGAGDSLQHGSGGDARGGAIYADGGTVELESVSFLTNSAYVAPSLPQSDAIRGGGNAGGALCITNASAYLGHSLLAGNKAEGVTWGGGLFSHGYGGYVHGGAVFVAQGAELRVVQSTLAANVALGAVGGRGIIGGDAFGGAICSFGSVSVEGTTFQGDQSVPGDGALAAGGYAVGRGGAIASVGTLVVNATTFASNLVVSASDQLLSLPPSQGGGAIWSGGVLNATNCTFATNSALAKKDGGGTTGVLGTGGALALSAGTARLVQLTLAGNQVNEGLSPELRGGGLYVENASVILLNSILAYSGPGGDCHAAKAISDDGGNLCSDGTAVFTHPTSHVNTDPRLAALADNDGPTFTMALLPGSPALDAVASGAPTDQRGVIRPQGAGVDSGAFEFSPDDLIRGRPTIKLNSSVAQQSITFTALRAGSYRLLFSVDLKSWTSIATNTAAVGQQMQFAVPAAPFPKRFFRVVTP
jgi:hypothetical protein